MLSRNWSSVLRPLCRPQKNSKALRSVLKSDRFFLGVPKRLRKECLPLDLVLFLQPYSAILFFFSTILLKLMWSCVGNGGCVDVSCCRLWKPWLVSALCYHSLSFHGSFSLFTFKGNTQRLLKQSKCSFSALLIPLSSSLMDTKLSSVKLICLFRSQMTSMNTQESVFRKVQPGQSSTTHLTNTRCFHKHLKSLLFSIMVLHTE